MKILQCVVLNRLNEGIYTDGKYRGILNRKQIGFIKGGGCDLNILKLRAKAKTLIKGSDFSKKMSILFIDFKYAFDSVNHTILFEKLLKFGYDRKLVNTIKFLYSNYKLKFSWSNEVINVNRGVCQGDLMSPILFDLYVNGLVEALDKSCYDVLAYADDIAIICESDSQLLEAISIVETWTEGNDITVNYKKSGIMYLNSSFEQGKTFCLYPVVREYKYLGVLIDSKLLVKKHTNIVASRIVDYIGRNKRLLAKYFSPKSYLKIFSYFQKSRLVYGLSTFLDSSSCMKNLKSKLMTFTKSIFSLPITTSHKRIRATLALPSVNYFLLGQLLKNVRKYEEMFDEEMTDYDNTLRRYFPDEILRDLHRRDVRMDYPKF